MTRRRFILAAFCSALFGMLLAVLTNQGTFTPTGAHPRPRKETRWIRPPPTPASRNLTWPTPPKDQNQAGTATPTNTHPTATPNPTTPTTQTSRSSTTTTTGQGLTGSTTTSTPTDTTASTPETTTTTEGAAVTSTTPTLPPPPPSPLEDAQSAADDALGIGLPHDDPWTLETLQRATRLFGPEPDKLPGYWAGQRHYYPWPSA